MVYGHDDLFDFLLSIGADVNFKDEIGDTVLKLTVFHWRRYIACRLIDEGCNWKVLQDGNGNNITFSRELRNELLEYGRAQVPHLHKD